MIGRVFQALDADWEQFKAMLVTSIRMDFRGQPGPGGKRRLSPVTRSLIVVAIMGTALAAGLMNRATPFFYALLILSYSMVMTAFSVILELGQTLINPEDGDVLSHRPVTSRTYFMARLTNLLFYIAIIATSMCLIPSALGPAVRGNTWTFIPVFFLVSLIANVTTGAAVLLLYTALLRMMRYERFKDVIAYLQIGFAFILFFVYQLIPRISMTAFVNERTLSGKWLYALPPAWFAGAVQFILGETGMRVTALAAVAGFSSLLLWVFSFRRISLDYARLISELQTASEPAPRIRNEASRSVRRFREWNAHIDMQNGYRFVLTQMRRDRTVKMALYPIFGMPLAVTALTILEGGLADPFINVSWGAQGGYTPMIQFFIFFMIYFFIRGLSYSSNWEAAWIFHTAPIRSPGSFFQGVKLAVFFRLLVPFFFILSGLYCLQIPIVHALKHMATLFLFGLVAFSAVSLMIREYPFSKKRERGERAQRFAFLFFVAPFFGAAFFLQTLAYRTMLGWVLLQGSLFLIFIILEVIGSRFLNTRLGNLECSV